MGMMGSQDDRGPLHLLTAVDFYEKYVMPGMSFLFIFAEHGAFF